MDKTSILKRKLGKIIGYITGYFLFTTVLYLILTWLDKIPQTWNYFYLALIILFLTLIGALLQRILK